MAKSKTIPLPTCWQDDFRSATFRTSFMLTLSQSMLEFLCAVSDGVQWDRSQWSHVHKPDNFLASGRSLQKRGLIVRKSDDEVRKMRHEKCEPFEYNFWKLTPAGEVLVELLKVTGMFVESDASIAKRSRRRKRG